MATICMNNNNRTSKVDRLVEEDVDDDKRCLSACLVFCVFFFSSRRRHTRCSRDWSSDVCSSDLDSERVRLSRRVVLEFLASSVDVSTAPQLRAYMKRYKARAEKFGPRAATVAQPPKIDNEIGRAHV